MRSCPLSSILLYALLVLCSTGCTVFSRPEQAATGIATAGVEQSTGVPVSDVSHAYRSSQQLQRLLDENPQAENSEELRGLRDYFHRRIGEEEDQALGHMERDQHDRRVIPEPVQRAFVEYIQPDGSVRRMQIALSTRFVVANRIHREQVYQTSVGRDSGRFDALALGYAIRRPEYTSFHQGRVIDGNALRRQPLDLDISLDGPDAPESIRNSEGKRSVFDSTVARGLGLVDPNDARFTREDEGGLERMPGPGVPRLPPEQDDGMEDMPGRIRDDGRPSMPGRISGGGNVRR